LQNRKSANPSGLWYLLGLGEGANHFGHVTNGLVRQ
jgi:hypothetical protein